LSFPLVLPETLVAPARLPLKAPQGGVLPKKINYIEANLAPPKLIREESCQRKSFT